MSRFYYILALFLTLSCARSPHRALWQCVEMDRNSTLTVDDSIARYAYHFYSQYGSARNKMMASYYLGQAEYDAGETLPATLHFKQAYDLATRLDDPSYMGFSCQRLSRLYAQNFDVEMSACYARLAIPLLERCGDTLSANYSRIDLAERYMAQEKFAQSEAIIDSLLECKPAHWILDPYASLIKANIRFFQNDFESALQYYKRLDSLSGMSSVLYGRLAMIAGYQGKQKQADSLIALAADRMVNEVDSINYFSNKEQLSLMREDYQGAYENLYKSTLLQDQSVNEVLSRSVTHSLQTYYEQEYLAEKNKRKNLNIVFFLSMLLLSMAIVIIVITMRRRKEQIVAQMAQMETLNQELQQTREGQKGARSVISSLVQDRINTMSQLASTYLSWSDEAVSLREAQHGKIFKEDIISEFRKELRRLRDDEHFIPSIEDALNQSYDGIISRIRQDCMGVSNGSIRVNDKDIQLMVLFIARFSNSSVAFLLDMTDDAVRTRKKNLRKVLLSLENGRGEEYLALLDGDGHKTATGRC